MPSDLERFLQQAAERLAEKVNQAQGAKRPPAPRPPRSVRQAERQRLDPDIVDAEILDEEIVPPKVARVSNRRELGPDPLSNIDTRPGLAQKISQADERMQEHVQDQLDHDIVQLRDASQALTRNNTSTEAQSSSRTPKPHAIIGLLRNPDTLKAAFIASEIFKRKV